MSQSYNPNYALLHNWFGLLRVRSPLLAESLLFSSPKGTQMFQFPSFAFHIRGIMQLHCIGLPHSEIFGSKVICTYPKLVAAYHVLHRLPEPRHPPFALILLSLFFFARLQFIDILAYVSTNPQCLLYRIALLLLLYFSLFPICQRSYFNDQLSIINYQLDVSRHVIKCADCQCFTTKNLFNFFFSLKKQHACCSYFYEALHFVFLLYYLLLSYLFLIWWRISGSNR